MGDDTPTVLGALRVEEGKLMEHEYAVSRSSGGLVGEVSAFRSGREV
jgi:hypothetical protein